MITEQDIREHEKKYPTFQADRLIKWLTEKRDSRGKGFAGFKTVKAANTAFHKAQSWKSFVASQD